MFYFAQVGRGERDIFQCIVWILCFIASGKSHQLARELEVWGRATGNEQIPAGWDYSSEVTKVCLFDETGSLPMIQKVSAFSFAISLKVPQILSGRIFYFGTFIDSWPVGVERSSDHPQFSLPHTTDHFISCAFFSGWNTVWIWLECIFSKQIRALGTASQFLVYLWYYFLFYRYLGG